MYIVNFPILYKMLHLVRFAVAEMTFKVTRGHWE